MRKLFGALAAAACASSVLAADPASAAGGFQKPPEAALKELRATVGRPFSAGYVFVDGRYIPPPYKVERHGTVIRINGIQVTRELIPWNEFIKTQAGVKAEKTVIPGDPAPAAAPEPAPAPEETVEEEDEEVTGDVASNLDDLFNDNPTPKKKSTTKKKRVVRRPAAPRPRQPTVVTTYSFDGEFVHNEKTRAYLEKLNAARTRIDKSLRMGGYYCFGSRYSAVAGNSSVAQSFINTIPPLMQRYSTYDSFASAVNSSGFGFLPVPLVEDLFRNRIWYRMIEERKKADEEKRQWSNLLGK